MIKKAKLIMALCALLMVSCGNPHLMYEYKKGLSIFPKEYVDHFPKASTFNALNNYTLMYDQADRQIDNPIAQPYCSDITMMKFAVQYVQDEKSFRDAYWKLESNSETILHANDSMLMFVFDYCEKFLTGIEGEEFPSWDTAEKKILIEHNMNVVDGVPVLYINFDEYKGNTLSRLDDSFIYYITEAKPGIFTTENLLHNENVEILPEKWKHGLTRGAAVSEKLRTIIYWVVVW